MTSEAVAYFSAMKYMSEDLHINYAFDNNLIQRFTDNIGNNDSLLIVSSVAYQTIDTYLKENDNRTFIKPVFRAPTLMQEARNELLGKKITMKELEALFDDLTNQMIILLA